MRQRFAQAWPAQRDGRGVQGGPRKWRRRLWRQQQQQQQRRQQQPFISVHLQLVVVLCPLEAAHTVGAGADLHVEAGAERGRSPASCLGSQAVHQNSQNRTGACAHTRSGACCCACCCASGCAPPAGAVRRCQQLLAAPRLLAVLAAADTGSRMQAHAGKHPRFELACSVLPAPTAAASSPGPPLRSASASQRTSARPPLSLGNT